MAPVQAVGDSAGLIGLKLGGGTHLSFARFICLDVNEVHKRLNPSEDFKIPSDILIDEFPSSTLNWAMR
jgi:hypothetical protein